MKNCPQWGLNSQPQDYHSHVLPTMLSHYLVVVVNQQGLYKVMLYQFNSSPKYEMVYEAKVSSLQKFLNGSVGRAWD